MDCEVLMDKESVEVRLVRVEGEQADLKTELKELKTDIRSLTQSVSQLASSVAVLGERVSHFVMRPTIPSAPPPPIPNTVPVVAGASIFGASVGGAMMIKLMTWLGLNP